MYNLLYVLVLLQYPKEEVDKDHLILLVLEVLPKDGCLVFCPTKKNCQNVALLLTQHFPEYVFLDTYYC